MTHSYHLGKDSRKGRDNPQLATPEVKFRESSYFPRACALAGEMRRGLTPEKEEPTDSERREDNSMEDPKEVVTLAFVRENAGAKRGPRSAQQQGRKKKKKKKKKKR